MDITPTIPARTTLLSLPPVGAGTGAVESLTSFVTSLSGRHDVALCHMDTFITRGAVDSLSGNPMPIPDPRRLDAPTQNAAQYAARLAQLTGQTAVASLGLGGMADVVANFRTLRKNVCWCPLCIRDAHLDRTPPHMQLSWLIPEVEICTIHRVQLRSACDSCGATFDIRNGIPFPYQQCPHCRELLSRGSCIAAERSGKELNPRVLAAEAVHDLLSHSASLLPNEGLEKPDLRRIIDSAKEREICSGTNEFCQVAGICKGTLSLLLNGNCGNLGLWVRVSLAADLSLAGLFVPRLWGPAKQGAGVSLIHRRPKRQRINWPEVKAEISNRLANGTAEGIAALSARKAHDPKHLRVNLGDLADQYDSAALQLAESKRNAAVQRLAIAMRTEAAHLITGGHPLSIREISRRVKVGRHSDLFRTALAMVQNHPDYPLQIGRRTRANSPVSSSN